VHRRLISIEPTNTSFIRFPIPETLRKRILKLFNRENNLWKSRYCERCKQTDIRGTFIGINYFFVGQQKWSSEIPPDNEQGCVGCFWHDPGTWRASLNEVLSQSEEDK